MNANVTWQGGMAFTGAAGSGFTVNLDAEPAVGGQDGGFRPMELMALSLAGCTAMDVISILQKKRQDVRAFQVQVHAKRASEHPKVFVGARIEYHLTGLNLDEAAVLRAIDLSAQRYCPAQAMLGKVMQLDLEYVIYEGESEAERQEVRRGVYQPPAG